MLTLQEAQTGVLDASTDASASNFLDREKAILGDDANQFEDVADEQHHHRAQRGHEQGDEAGERHLQA